MPELIDLSHSIEHGMITYKGLPAPLICDYLSRERSRQSVCARYRIPYWQDRDGGEHRHLSRQPLSSLCRWQGSIGAAAERLANLECVVAHVPPSANRAIDRLPFSPAEVRGRAVLVHTGWDRHWRTDQYFENHPYLTGGLAEWLAQAGAVLVGVDSYNIDCTDAGERPVHSILLAKEIPIVEHLCGLAVLPKSGSRFFATPPKIKAFGTFAVRAFAVL